MEAYGAHSSKSPIESPSKGASLWMCGVVMETSGVIEVRVFCRIIVVAIGRLTSLRHQAACPLFSLSQDSTKHAYRPPVPICLCHVVLFPQLDSASGAGQIDQRLQLHIHLQPSFSILTETIEFSSGRCYHHGLCRVRLRSRAENGSQWE